MRQLVNEILNQLDPQIKYSLDAENLVLGTIAQESAYGKYRKQLGSGPALGICQMEPATFNDIVSNFLKYKPELSAKIKQIAQVSAFNSNDLYLNDRLSICMCLCAYFRQKEAIPNTVEGYAILWKLRYNTPGGKGTEIEFIKNYQLHVLNSI